jgi:hypothetical protein
MLTSTIIPAIQETDLEDYNSRPAPENSKITFQQTSKVWQHTLVESQLHVRHK